MNLTDEQIIQACSEIFLSDFPLQRVAQGCQAYDLAIARAIESAVLEAAGGREWQPIEAAPKDRAIMLWMPEMEYWAEGPWRGCWSHAHSKWVVHAPFSLDGKAVTMSGFQQPTHWMPLPPPPAGSNGGEG